jgi:tRNA A-37 threonylcarbamoyl transferase component Bud32
MRINYLILAGALSGCIKDDSSGTKGINPNPKSDIENKESIKHISGGGVIHSGVIPVAEAGDRISKLVRDDKVRGVFSQIKSVVHRNAAAKAAIAQLKNNGILGDAMHVVNSSGLSSDAELENLRPNVMPESQRRVEARNKADKMRTMTATTEVLQATHRQQDQEIADLHITNKDQTRDTIMQQFNDALEASKTRNSETASAIVYEFSHAVRKGTVNEIKEKARSATLQIQALGLSIPEEQEFTKAIEAFVKNQLEARRKKARDILDSFQAYTSAKSLAELGKKYSESEAALRALQLGDEAAELFGQLQRSVGEKSSILGEKLNEAEIQAKNRKHEQAKAIVDKYRSDEELDDDWHEYDELVKLVDGTTFTDADMQPYLEQVEAITARREVVNKRSVVTDVLVPDADPSAVERFWRTAHECTSLPVTSGDISECPGAGTTLTVDGLGQLTLLPRADESKDRGGYGRVFRTDKEGIIVKVSFFEWLCRDMAGLAAMDGLDGLVPRWYPISPSDHISAFCRQRVVVMNSVGDRTLSELENEPISPREKYQRMFGILKSLRAIHKLGLAHSDFNSKNMRVFNDDPSKIGVVDFGTTHPFERRVTPAGDLRMLAVYASDEREVSEWFEKFVKIFSSAWPGCIKPDYNVWVSIFESLAAGRQVNDFLRKRVDRTLAELKEFNRKR